MRTVADIFRSYEELDIDGRHINGTDKQGPNHNYGDAYESLFYGSKIVDVQVTDRRVEPMYDRTTTRGDVKLMMEVGVADGSSLLAWCEVFPNARCVALDIHDAERISSGQYNNTEFHMGDQRSRADCERAAGGRLFDVIVEDATHKLENTLLTMFWLWPYVRPGGLYIVEEWENINNPVDRGRIRALWPHATIVETVGPSGGTEPLVVFRKPM